MQARIQLWLILLCGVMLNVICVMNFQFAVTTLVNSNSPQNSTLTCASCEVIANRTNHTNSAPLLKLNWINDVDTIYGSYYWFIGVSRLAGGVLCKKYGPKAVFGYSSMLLALLNLLIPYLIRYSAALFFIRSVQGICHGVSFPQTFGSLCSTWVPPDERSKFMTVASGIGFGIGGSYLTSSWIILTFGWQATFLIHSSCMLIWCVFWYLFVTDTPQQHPRITSQERDYIVGKIGDSVSPIALPVPWKSIFLSKAVLVNLIANWSTQWLSIIGILYLPSFYLNALHMNVSTTGALSAVPFALHAVFAVIFGALIDALVSRSVITMLNARRAAVFIGCVVTGILFASILLLHLDTSYANTIAFVTILVIVLNGSAYCGYTANVVDLSPNFCAVIYGVQGLITSSVGYLDPLLVKYILAENPSLQKWYQVFFMVGLLRVMGGTIFILFGSSSIQPWNYSKDRATTTQYGTQQVEEHQL